MPTLVPALLTMVAAQLFDLGTFVVMVRRMGSGAEANPLVVSTLSTGGLPDVVLAKLALIVLIGAVTVALMTMRGRGLERTAWVLLACAIVAGMVGGGSNALTMGPL